MANDFKVSIDVACSADEAWKKIGNPADVGWFPPVVAAEVRDGVRYASMVDGRNLVEKIVTHDDTARAYSYSVVEGTSAKLNSHLATLSVEEAGDGSRIVWHTVAEPEDSSVDLEGYLAKPMMKGLENLKSLLEVDGE